MVERIDLEHGVKRHIPSGELSPEGIVASIEQLAQGALDYATSIGFVRVGLADLAPFATESERLETFLDAGHAGNMAYLASRDASGELLRSSPQALMKEAKIAVVAALPYSGKFETPKKGVAGRVASYAQGADYHDVVRELLLRVADHLAERSHKEVLARVCVDSAPLLERDLARRAGLTFFGKNTLAIAPGAGSHFLLGVLLVDLPIDAKLTSPPDGCGSCTLCLEACPTDAFVGPYQMDATRCISYLTIETNGTIPTPLRGQMGDHLFGCDDCQSICPYNAKGQTREPHPRLAPMAHLSLPSAIEILKLGSAAYKRLVRGSALRRASRNQLARNAAVVLGNSADEQAVEPLLEAAQRHKSEIVRQHATWALRQLAEHHQIESAQSALKTLRAVNDEVIRDELHPLEESRSAHPAADTHRD